MRCGYIHVYRDTLHMIKLQAPTYEYQIFFDYKVKVFRYIFKQPKLLMTRVERIKIFEYHLKKKIPRFLFLNSYSLVLQAKYFLYNALKEFFPFLPFLFQFLLSLSTISTQIPRTSINLQTSATNHEIELAFQKLNR